MITIRTNAHDTATVTGEGVERSLRTQDFDVTVTHKRTSAVLQVVYIRGAWKVCVLGNARWMTTVTTHGNAGLVINVLAPKEAKVRVTVYDEHAEAVPA